MFFGNPFRKRYNSSFPRLSLKKNLTCGFFNQRNLSYSSFLVDFYKKRQLFKISFEKIFPVDFCQTKSRNFSTKNQSYRSFLETLFERIVIFLSKDSLLKRNLTCGLFCRKNFSSNSFLVEFLQNLQLFKISFEKIFPVDFCKRSLKPFRRKIIRTGFLETFFEKGVILLPKTFFEKEFDLLIFK